MSGEKNACQSFGGQGTGGKGDLISTTVSKDTRPAVGSISFPVPLFCLCFYNI